MKCIKKKIAALLVIAVLGSSSIFAANWGRIGAGIGGLGGGALIMAMPALFDWDDEAPATTVVYVTGGVCLLLGLIGVIWGALEEDNAYAKLTSDPVLKHVSFGAAPQGIYLGTRFTL